MILKDKVAIVTGAERGIGRAIAVAFAREGASVVVNYIQSQKAAAEVVEEILQAGGMAAAIRADISNLDDHSTLIDGTIERFHGLDILVNNAGIQVDESIFSARPETWDLTLGVNLRGSFFLSCKAAAWMKSAGRGKIICISSVHDVEPLKDRAIYSISKAGLNMLVKSLALELGEHHVQVNTISPGAILTDFNKHHLNDSVKRDKLIGQIPAGRIGSPADITGAAVFLASAASDYVTGTTIYVDGGLLLL
ncbi:MAG: glucose 1-dehydrogenase [Edaphobacter sp.]